MKDGDVLPNLEAKRTGVKTYTIQNSDGATLKIGPLGAPGVFSPGELLQAAIAGCSALSAEAQLAHVLGEDFELTAVTEAIYNAADNRIEELITSLEVDASELSEEKLNKLIATTDRVVERLCTIKRSLKAGVAASSLLVHKEKRAQ